MKRESDMEPKQITPPFPSSAFPSSVHTEQLMGIYPPALAEIVSVRNGRNLPGPVQVRELLANRAPQNVYPVHAGVAIINVSGVMSKYADWETAYFGGSVHTELEAAIKTATNDPNVKAILIRIDSPGGSVAGVSDLADAIYAARQVKTVVAYVSDLAASCGYYVASQCERIYSDSDALIGCIGTINVIYDFSKMLEEAGIQAFVFTSEQDPNKGAGVPGSPLTEVQQQYIQQMVDDLGAKFIEDIYRGRPSLQGGMTLPDGRVHIASKALEQGLIDGIRPFDDVLMELQQSASKKTAAGGQRHATSLLSRKLALEEAEQPAG